MSFLDSYSGYHQIYMIPKDEKKSAFITEGGTFYNRRMPFGLKNVGAIYQRSVKNIF